MTLGQYLSATDCIKPLKMQEGRNAQLHIISAADHFVAKMRLTAKRGFQLCEWNIQIYILKPLTRKYK